MWLPAPLPLHRRRHLPVGLPPDRPPPGASLQARRSRSPARHRQLPDRPPHPPDAHIPRLHPSRLRTGKPWPPLGRPRRWRLRPRRSRPMLVPGLWHHAGRRMARRHTPIIPYWQVSAFLGSPSAVEATTREQSPDAGPWPMASCWAQNGPTPYPNHSVLAGLGLPWVALGGGGYDQGAFARCWSLAYGIMLGAEWPDAIPQSFRDKYGLEALRDTAAPQVDPPLQEQIQNFAQDTIQQVHRLIFPTHHLA